MADQLKPTWLAFHPDRHTLIAFSLSIGVIIASAGQLLFQSTSSGLIGRLSFSMLITVTFIANLHLANKKRS